MLPLGEVDGDSLVLGLVEAEAECDGDVLGDSLVLGLSDPLGLVDGDSLALGEVL